MTCIYLRFCAYTVICVGTRGIKTECCAHVSAISCCTATFICCKKRSTCKKISSSKYCSSVCVTRYIRTPNITGGADNTYTTVLATRYGSAAGYYGSAGAFTISAPEAAWRIPVSSVAINNIGEGGINQLTFDASNSNSVYGASGTVQAPAYQALMIIKA